MASLYKLDDGQWYPTNCFPAKSLLQPRSEEGAGHWQVARHNVEKTKIKWLFGTRAAQQSWQDHWWRAQRPKAEKILNRAQLMKLHAVQKPSDLCSVNISHQNFALARESDFVQFDSVAYVNATENLLTLETFRSFPALRELELSLNGLRNLKVRIGDFPHLEILDLSYNNLSPEDVQILGILPHLKALHLTANGLSSLPLNLAASESRNSPKFPALEVLLLDDNHLSDSSVFVSLASLRRLKQLNLDKNRIKEVPYLHYTHDNHFSVHPLSAKSGIRAGLHCRKNAMQKPGQDRSPRLHRQYSYIITQNAQDPDKTEVVFQTRPPEETSQERPLSPLKETEVPCASIPTEFLLPLPDLRFLSLANNQIEHEEDLLAVALFPSLAELTFYGNPFTVSRSGDPPLLTSFLQNKLGIKLVRKKVSKLEKPRIFIPIKANREIKSQLPKIRKRPLPAETSVETTFWQLWTGSELDPNNKLSSQDLTLSPSCSFTYNPDRPILAPLRREERSTSLSMLYIEPLTPGSSLEDLSRDSEVLYESSLDQILAGKVPASQPLSAPSNSEVLPPPSRSASQGPSGSPRITELPSSDQVLSEAPENASEFVPDAWTSPGEHSRELQWGLLAPPNSPSEGQSESEVVQLVGPGEEGRASGAEPSHPASVTTSSAERKGTDPMISSEGGLGEVLGVPVSPSGGSSAEDEDLEESGPISVPSGEDPAHSPPPEAALPSVSSEEDEDQEGSSQLPTAGFQEMNLSASSEEEEHPRSLSSPLVDQGQEESLTLENLPPGPTPSQPSVPASRSVSGELQGLFAQIRAFALPPDEEEKEEEDDDTSAAEEVLTSSSGEGVTQPIFITQVDESLDSRGTQQRSGKATPPVPERFRGYEDLLGGDPGPDFVEPKGIQQNVQALEKALRYPLVYRDPKARLDRYQKPYVAAQKKVLRIPAPKPRKSRMERLEEILLELRKPTNVLHIPLVCVLRRRKENWREYREALELLKEFQKDYKSQVAIRNKIGEARTAAKDPGREAEVNPIVKFQSLPEVKARRKLHETSAQVLQEKNDSFPSNERDPTHVGVP